MSNVKNERRQTITTILRRPAFVEGFKDFCRGKPLQEIRDPDYGYEYERGRLIAAGIASEGLDPSTFLPFKSNIEILHILYKKVAPYANPHSRVPEGAFERHLKALKSKSAAPGMNLL